MRSLVQKMQVWRSNPSRLRIRSKDRILFAKRLSAFLRAGIPILVAVDLIRDTPGSKCHSRLLGLLSNQLQSGVALSQALSSFPRSYSIFHTQLIAIGEASGTLPNSLTYLAHELEQRAARIRSVLGTLTYPAILLFGSLGVSGFLIIYAFPKIVPLFRGLHAKLPFTTRALLWLSILIQKHGLILLLLFFGILCTIIVLIRLPRLRNPIDTWVLRVPVVGKLFQLHILASVFRATAILLTSGVRLDQSLVMAHDGISNTVYRAALTNIRAAILAGGRFSKALALYPNLFPPVSVQLVTVGEMTGTLSESTDAAAHLFEEECVERLRLLSSLLEPIIMVVMGLVIGFVALAIISPMYGITQNLST